MVRGDDTSRATASQGLGTVTSAAVACEEYNSAVLTLTTTAVSGTSPTLDVTVQTASDSAFTTPVAVGTFAQKTTATSERKIFVGLDSYVRFSSVIGGSATPTVTWGISGFVR